MKRGQLYTTFKMLKKKGACRDRYRYLARNLGGINKYGIDKPIPLALILAINGFNDAIWAFIAVPEKQRKKADKILRLFACWCVRNTPLQDGRKVWDLLTDERSRTAVEVAEQYARGEATDEELEAAWDAAWDAARDAAWDAAWGAARDAAWDAARGAQKEQLRKMLQ